MEIKFIFCVIFLLGVVLISIVAEPDQDKQALLDFIQNINRSRPLNWEENRNRSICSNWTGITCNHDKSRIIALRLPGFGFHGDLPPNTIGRLSALQIISLRSNRISGYFPSDFLRLQNLTTLDLQYNSFHGPLPNDFSVWENLSFLNLSNNFFNGTIPSSISKLTRLRYLDLANNNLTGNLPESLRRFPNSAFSGNNLSPLKKHSKINHHMTVVIITAGFSVAFISIALLLVYKRSENKVMGKKQRKERFVNETVSSGKNVDENGLVFMDGCNLPFDLEDLLRASAEVLGKGNLGTTYKATIEEITTVAVKRLKEVNVGRREFEQHMEFAGNSIRHENVVPVRAYYYSKEEKLVVYDFYEEGSVSAMLHVRRGEKRTALNWETRLKIAIGAARGIAHIHTQNHIHGNIKSSNVFLNSKRYGCVSDLGLGTLLTPTTPLGGYLPPEVKDTRRLTQASDIYSFGILLLELLTGKPPFCATAGGSEEAVELVKWVQLVVKEEWTGEVFDVELMRYPNIEEEMVEMLQIGMSCVVTTPERRPEMVHVVKMVEEIRRVNLESRVSTDSRSEGSVPVADLDLSYVSLY